MHLVGQRYVKRKKPSKKAIEAATRKAYLREWKQSGLTPLQFETIVRLQPGLILKWAKAAGMSAETAPVGMLPVPHTSETLYSVRWRIERPLGPEATERLSTLAATGCTKATAMAMCERYRVGVSLSLGGLEKFTLIPKSLNGDTMELRGQAHGGWKR